MNTQLATDAGYARGGSVIKRREHETHADLGQTRLRQLRRGGNVYAKRRQNIRAARTTAGRAIPMLGYRQARTRNNKCRRR